MVFAPVKGRSSLKFALNKGADFINGEGEDLILPRQGIHAGRMIPCSTLFLIPTLYTGLTVRHSKESLVCHLALTNDWMMEVDHFLIHMQKTDPNRPFSCFLDVFRENSSSLICEKINMVKIFHENFYGRN